VIDEKSNIFTIPVAKEIGEITGESTLKLQAVHLKHSPITVM
jgi:hypothetical protein